MSPKQKKRLTLVLILVAGVGAATALALTAFKENMLYFYDPSQIAAGEAPTDHTIRVGGMVTQGSIKRAPDSLEVAFDVTDYKHNLTVKYTGILPDLFREGQGIVAIGKMQPDGSFMASEVLAKHDENYMPPEVADSLKTAEGESGAAQN